MEKRVILFSAVILVFTVAIWQKKPKRIQEARAQKAAIAVSKNEAFS